MYRYFIRKQCCCYMYILLISIIRQRFALIYMYNSIIYKYNAYIECESYKTSQSSKRTSSDDQY